MAQQKWIWLVSMRTLGGSLALLSGLKIWHCRELWYRSQMRLGSGIAVVWASGYSFDLTLSLGTSACCGCSPKKKRKKKSYALPFNTYSQYFSTHGVSKSCHCPVNTRITPFCTLFPNNTLIIKISLQLSFAYTVLYLIWDHWHHSLSLTSLVRAIQCYG